MIKILNSLLLGKLTTAIPGIVVPKVYLPAPQDVGDVWRITLAGRAVAAGGGDITLTMPFMSLSDVLGLTVPHAAWNGGGSWKLDLLVTLQLTSGQAYDPLGGTPFVFNSVGTFVAPDGSVIPVGIAEQDAGGSGALRLDGVATVVASTTGSAGDALELDVQLVEKLTA